MILLLLILLFTVLSMILLSGKGSFLIAGYNTSSKEEKAQYDEKKLSRLMGIAMLIITLFLVISYFYQELALVLLSVGTIIISILLILLVDPICRKDHKRNSKMKLIGVCIFSIISFVFIYFTVFYGSVEIQLYDDHIECRASLIRSIEIEYQDIKNVEWVHDMDIGSKKTGINNYIIKAGSYQNDLYGRYYLYSYNNVKEYIVIYTDHVMIVINDKEHMEQYYQQIKKKIAGRTSSCYIFL